MFKNGESNLLGHSVGFTKAQEYREFGRPHAHWCEQVAPS